MNGLSHNRANIDCFEKRVVFEREDGKKIHFMGENRKAPTKIILAMTAMEYLRKGYDANLTFVVDNKVEEINLRRVPIVNRFEDVFSEELP